MAPDESALVAGENIDISNVGLSVRNGTAIVSAIPGSDPVVRLESFALPSSGVSYLIAQTMGPNRASKLFASPVNDPDMKSLRWTQIYDLGPGADFISVTALNDRVILTEGKAATPLVFPGALEPSGSDWALPLAVSFAMDEAENWIDVSDSALDADTETAADIGPFRSGLSIRLAVCLDTPIVTALLFELAPGPTQRPAPIVKAFSGSWLDVDDISDKTSGLSQAGVISWPAGSFTLKATSINGVEGFWIKMLVQLPEAQSLSIRRILFQAPCQPLSVIGKGSPDSPLGFIFWDESAKSAKDFTIEVQDFTYPSFARLNDGALENPQPMSPGDFIYVGYITRFRSVELTVHNDFTNAGSSSLSAEYWNGQDWRPVISLIDGTATDGGVTLSKKGRVSWDVPDDWLPNRPIAESYPYGHWIRLTVSSDLTPKTFISEAAIAPIFDPLKKYRFAITVRDRVILLNRTDSSDRIEIARPLEEFGFCGADSAYLRIGGTGEIVAAVEVFNQGFIAKSDDWYLLNGYSPPTFSVERAEAAGQVPVNSRVIIRAPHMEADSKNLMGLYYINQNGAWHFAGLKVYRISDQVSWWDSASEGDRIDVASLKAACGVYWAARNRIMWAVPMITGSGRPTRNNRIIVYDLNLGAWAPPFTISATSLATVATGAPNSGGVAVIAGDSSGRVFELFARGSWSDGTAVVRGWADTPWMSFGSPGVEKSLRVLTACGVASGAEAPRVEIFADGDSDSMRSVDFPRLLAADRDGFALEQKSVDARGRFFRFRVRLAGNSRLYGLQASFVAVREWGSM